MISPFFREFITELANCDKFVVGAVSGSVNGLGVGMLLYFDFVCASNTSTFYLPYANLGQPTEGGLASAASCSNIPDALVIANLFVQIKTRISSSSFVFTVSKYEKRSHHSCRGGTIWVGDRIFKGE